MERGERPRPGHPGPGATTGAGHLRHPAEPRVPCPHLRLRDRYDRRPIPSTWGDFAGRLRQINLVAYDPAASPPAMRTVPLQHYAYDDAGRLRAAWNPQVSPALKATYAYDGNGVLTQMTPPGLAPWTFAYGTTSDDGGLGRLKSVTRAAAGLATQTTTVAYGVPLSGAAAPYSMTASNVSLWGQHDLPTDATAIFPPNHVPASPPTSSAPAVVYYLNVRGQQVNQASPGARISTTEHDSNGQVVRDLDPANRARALQAPDSFTRSLQIDTQNTYSTDGLQLLQTLEPLHAAHAGRRDRGPSSPEDRLDLRPGRAQRRHLQPGHHEDGSRVAAERPAPRPTGHDLRLQHR